MTKNKVLIFGGSSGLGLELAKNFLKLNFHVVISSSKKKSFKNSKNILKKISSKFSFIKCNLKIDSDVDKIIKFINKNKINLECVVLSSGEGIIGALDKINSKVLNNYLKAFAFSYIRIINCLTDNKKINPDIIYISSYVAHFYSNNLSIYSFVKKTIDHFLRLLSKSYLGKILIVYPGSLNTKFDQKSLNYLNSKKVFIKKKLPPEEISIEILEYYKKNKKFYYSNYLIMWIVNINNLMGDIINKILNFFHR